MVDWCFFNVKWAVLRYILYENKLKKNNNYAKEKAVAGIGLSTEVSIAQKNEHIINKL
jgi:hypothetical protein